MKSTKLLVLLAALALVACNPKNNSSSVYNAEDGSSQNVESQVSSEEQVIVSSLNFEQSSGASSKEESSYITVSSSSEAKSSSTEKSSSSKEQSSSTVISSSSQAQSSSAAASSSEATSSEEDQTTYKITFVNPSCGSFSKEVLNDRLAEYINEEVGFEFVTSIVSNDCQIGNGFPTAGNQILIIGASSTTGSLKFNFSQNVQAVSITAQTYHKPYINQGVEYPNVDANSVLRITAGTSRDIDLKPVDGQPVEKSFTEAIQSKTLTLSTLNDSYGRVFIKEITFIL